MPPLGPLPRLQPQPRVDRSESLRSTCRLVIVRPSPDHRIEDAYQVLLLGGFVLREYILNLGLERLDVFLRRRDNDLAVEAPHVLTEEIKPLRDMRHPRFLGREFQSSDGKKALHQWLDFRLQKFFRTARDHKVIRVTHQVNLAPSGFVVAFRPKVSLQFHFQSVQGPVGQRRRNNSALRRTCLRWKEFLRLDIAGLQPLPENLSVHADVRGQPVVADMVETALDITFQNPLRLAMSRQYRVTLADGIGGGPRRSKPIRVPISKRFRHRFEREQMQRLHRAVVQGRNTQRAVLIWLPGFRDIYPSQRTWLIATPFERLDSLSLLLRGGPRDAIHTRRASALILHHSSHGECFAAKRADQKSLQGFHPAPIAGLGCLHHTRL